MNLANLPGLKLIYRFKVNLLRLITLGVNVFNLPGVKLEFISGDICGGFPEAGDW